MRTAATLTAVAVATCLATRGAATAVQQDANAPTLVSNAAQPAYPARATRAGVEGAVEFEATVRADGSVDAVSVVRVPAADMGFEDAVRQAVLQWRFMPATRGGVAVASTYHGSVQFQLAIPGEWIYSAASHDVWNEVRELVRALKLPVDRMEPDHQLLVTRAMNYRTDLPDASAMELPLGQLPSTVQFHVYVAPGFEPARVSIGSIVQTRSMANKRDGFLLYANAAVSRWFLAKLTSGLGKAPEELSASAARRAEQTRRLMPAGLSDPCAEREAVLLTRVSEGTKPPRALSEVKPVYPWNELEDRHQSIVKFQGEVTEHGTLINVLHLSPQNASNAFRLASQLAGRLWRFESAQVDGCPARFNATFEMDFRIK